MPRITATFLKLTLISLATAYLGSAYLGSAYLGSAYLGSAYLPAAYLPAAYLASPAQAADTKLAAAATASSASELANQLAAAYGGMVKIKEMLNRGTRSHGMLSNMSSISSASNTFECEFVSKGNKTRIEMEIFGQPKIEVFDGKNGWEQTGDWVSRSDNKTVERIAEEMTHGLYALGKLDDLTCKLDLLPATQVNGKPCDVLKLTPPNGKWTVLYVDSVSRLVLRSEFMGLDSEQGVEALKTTDFADYRNIVGFPTPFRIDEFISGRKTRELIMDSVTVDDNISDELFQMPEESRYSRLELNPVTIPFEYVNNEIIITARINNGPESKFILDTASSQTVIDKTTAQAIGPITTHTFSVTGLSKAMPLSYTTLNKIQIGDLNLENIPTLVTDLSTLTATIGQRPAGLIGASILKRFLLTIDFQDRKITLADPHHVRVADNAIIVPTSPVFASTLLVVSGILDDKPMNFLVDTGAGFNNLPLSLAAAFNAKSILPVGQIQPVERQRTNIGSIKLNTLKLGNYTISNPVFAIQPDNKNDGGARGISSASGMGILGTPIWSKTRLNIDYRNNRLIIEIPPDRQKLEQFLQEIEASDRSYLRDKNSDVAATAYEKIMNTAHNDGVKAAEALALARICALYADRFTASKESRWLDMAAKEYERAAKIAAESRNKGIEGQILAQWAMLYLNAPRNSTDLISAQNLLKKALAREPMDASIYAALGCAMLKTGKSPVGITFIDRALTIDPSNWQALWEKYKLFQQEKKLADMKLVLAQMTRYYPDFPQVKELTAEYNKQLKASGASEAASSPKKAGAGKGTAKRQVWHPPAK